MVIVFNEIMFLFREKRIRKKEFFNQFFPERIKAHEEIMRIMTKGGLAGVDPKADSEITVKKKVERLSEAAHEASVNGLLFADKHICGMLLDLMGAASKVKVRNPQPMDKKIEEKSDLAEAIAEFNTIYYELLGALRKKSGVDLIEEVFEGIPQKGNSDSKGKKKNTPQAQKG